MAVHALIDAAVVSTLRGAVAPDAALVDELARHRRGHTPRRGVLPTLSRRAAAPQAGSPPSLTGGHPGLTWITDGFVASTPRLEPVRPQTIATSSIWKLSSCPASGWFRSTRTPSSLTLSTCSTSGVPSSRSTS